MDSFYHNTIFAGAVVTAVLSFCLLLVRTPDNKLFTTYKRATILLAIGYAIFSVGIATFLIFPVRARFPELCPALNLSYYFGAMFLFGYPFISLINPHYLSKKRSFRFLATYLTYVSTLWISMFLFPDFRLIAVTIYEIWFLIETVILVKVFFSSYNRLKRNLDKDYADSTATFIHWLNMSAWLVIICGVLCGVCAFCPSVFNIYLMLVGIFVFVYIYISWQNYVLHLHPIQIVAENPVEESAPLTGEDAPVFAERIQKWIEDKGYTAEKITLALLAQEIGTNRSYLSSYINHNYSCCFSDWINGLRLEYAKQLMADYPSMTLVETAQSSGFSSISYFSKLFKQAYGIPPSEYKRRL